MNSSDARQSFDLPVDLAAERQVLGILIKHPTQVDEVADRLRPSHFVDLGHRRIYEIILDLYHKQGRISYTQIYNRLVAESVDSPAELLIALTESFVSISELEPSVEILIRQEGLRRIIKACDVIKGMALDPKEEDLAALQARAQELIFDATQAHGGPENEVKNLLEVLSKCYLNLLRRREGLEDAYGLSVRFPSIDGMTTGFKKKDLIILAARPSMGKTALLLNMAANVAKRDIPVLIFSAWRWTRSSWGTASSSASSSPTSRAGSTRLRPMNTRLSSAMSSSSSPRRCSTTCITCPSPSWTNGV